MQTMTQKNLGHGSSRSLVRLKKKHKIKKMQCDAAQKDKGNLFRSSRIFSI